jgi:hypothetical protein
VNAEAGAADIANIAAPAAADTIPPIGTRENMTSTFGQPEVATNFLVPPSITVALSF